MGSDIFGVLPPVRPVVGLFKRPPVPCLLPSPSVHGGGPAGVARVTGDLLFPQDPGTRYVLRRRDPTPPSLSWAVSPCVPSAGTSSEEDVGVRLRSFGVVRHWDSHPSSTPLRLCVKEETTSARGRGGGGALLVFRGTPRVGTGEPCPGSGSPVDWSLRPWDSDRVDANELSVVGGHRRLPQGPRCRRSVSHLCHSDSLCEPGVLVRGLFL